MNKPETGGRGKGAWRRAIRGGGAASDDGGQQRGEKSQSDGKRGAGKASRREKSLAVRGMTDNLRLTRGQRALVIIAVALAAFLFTVSCYHIGSSYQRLEDAILQERIDYVGEISDQIITSMRFMRKSYTEQVHVIARILNNNLCDEFSDVQQLLSAVDAEVLLLSETGGMTDLTGAEQFILSRELTLKLYYSQGEAVQMFTSLSGRSDYWLFAVNIDPIVLRGVRYVSVVCAVPASAFRDNLAISLFDGRGASYIVREDGSVEIGPRSEDSVFTGYNLLAGLALKNVPKADVDALTEALKNDETGAKLFMLDNEDWLLTYDTMDDDHAIIVAVPVSVTAIKTYQGLDNVILHIVVTLVLAALIVFAVLWAFAARDRKHGRIVASAQAKSDFFSKMSHDIRTPLNAVIGMQTLAEDAESVSEMKNYLKQSTEASNYLLSIINDVLDMSRIDSGKLTLDNAPFNLNDLVGDTVAIIRGQAEKKGVQLIDEVKSPVTRLYVGDVVRIRQILINLLNNAVKFTPTGGRVSFQVTCGRRVGDRDEVVFTIRDTGIGMSPEFIKRMFMPFEQERSSLTEENAGSGLGLSIVHNLVTLMHGDVAARSRPGEGTRFTVTLPLKRGAEITQDDRRAPSGDVRAYPGRRVLLAEDNHINRQVAIAILQRKFGMTAEIAVNGREAVDLFARSPLRHFDFILMDVKMPVMDGLEATRVIRAMPRADAKTIPIVALSANAYEQDVKLSIEAGMNDHIPKPLDVPALSRAFDQYISGSKEGTS